MRAALLPLLLPLALLACGPRYSPDAYASRAVQQMNRVEQGVVIGRRSVLVEAAGETGAATGGAAGGIIGSQAPGGNMAGAIGAVGGALVGGLLGTTTERVAGSTTAFEYIVRKTNGELVSVTQRDETPLDVGERVLVIAGSQARIVPDYTAPVEPPPAPAPANPGASAPLPVAEPTAPVPDPPAPPAAGLPAEVP
jgi:outer membrane lipoprotein SlyB